MATLTSNTVLSLGLVGGLSGVISNTTPIQLEPTEVLTTEDVSFYTSPDTLSQAINSDVLLTHQVTLEKGSTTLHNLDSYNIVYDNEHYVLTTPDVFTSLIELHSPVIWHTQNYTIGSIGAELNLVESVSEIYTIDSSVTFIRYLDLVDSTSTIYPVMASINAGLDVLVNTNSAISNVISRASENLIMFMYDSHINGQSINRMSIFEGQLSILDSVHSGNLVSPISWLHATNLDLFENDNEISIVSHSGQAYLETIDIPITQGISRILVEAPSDLNVNEVVGEGQQNPTDVSISECIVYTDFMKDFFDNLGRLEDFDNRARIDNYPVEDSEPIRIGIFDNYSLHTFRTVNDRYN